MVTLRPLSTQTTSSFFPPPTAGLLRNRARSAGSGRPGSIQDARRTGALPLAVPRRAEFDEVVDNHQVPFTTLMEKRGHAVVVESREDLFAKLDLALANPSLFRTAEPYVSTPEISCRTAERGTAGSACWQDPP